MRSRFYLLEMTAFRLSPPFFFGLTGMGFGELTTLRWSDVDLPGRTITLRAYHTKTARGRNIPISARLFLELQRLYSERLDREADCLVFGITDNCKKSWKSACKDAGVEGLRIHDLSATFITRLIDAGMSVAEVAKISRHTQLQTLYDRNLRPTSDVLARAGQLLDAMHC